MKNRIKKLLPVKLKIFLLFIIKHLKASTYSVLLKLNSIKVFRKIFSYIFKFTPLEFRTYISFLDYQKEYSGTIIGENQAVREYSYSIPYFIQAKEGKLNSINQVQIQNRNVLIMNGVCINGNSNAILVGSDTMVYEMKFVDKDSRFLFTDGAFILSNDKISILSRKKNTKKIDKGIKLVANFSWNYFHFLYEVISKFYYIQHYNLDKNIPLIVDKKNLDVPQFFAILSMFNFDQREIITISLDERYYVDNLYVLPDALICPPNFCDVLKIMPEDFLFDFDALSYMRKIALENKKSGEYPKRLFLSRNKDQGRSTTNIDEIFNEFQKHGFVKLYPEKYTVNEQMAIFNNAEFIVGATGAAFSNILFCRPECKIICFTNFNIKIPLFSTLAAFVGVDMVYFYDESKELTTNSILHENFSIDILMVKDFIASNWGLNRAN